MEESSSQIVCIQVCLFVCVWFVYIWYTYFHYVHMIMWGLSVFALHVILCLRGRGCVCIWVWYWHQIKQCLNNVSQNVCCSLDHIQLVFLYAIKGQFRHFSTFHRGFQLLDGFSFVVSTGYVHVMSVVEGWRRVVMKQSQLQGLVWCVWAQGDAWLD